MLRNTNRVEIQLSFGELSPLIRWCERNCTREWSYEQISPSGNVAGEYEFYFEDEKDLVAFTIWKT